MRKRYWKKTVLSPVLGLLLAGFLMGIVHLYQEVIGTSDIDIGLLTAVQANDASGVREWLAEGIDPNFERNGLTPLQAARKNRNTEIERLLIKAGAKE